MTEPSIVEKLRVELAHRVNSEGKVVYILAESRKLLMSHPREPKPFALNFYCHWALHIDLHGADTILPFLNRVERFVESTLAGNQDVAGEHEMFREFVFLETFRQQFSQFLKSYDLPTAICDEDERWHEFLTHYAGVIRDGALRCRGETKLAHVSEVVFKIGKQTSGNHLPFDLVWEIHLKNGKILDVSVNSSPLPDGSPMISHHVHLRT